MGSPPGPRRAVRLLRAIGLRVLLWGGLAVVALLWLGDLGSLVGPLDWPPPGGVEQGPAGEDDPATAPPEDGWPHLRGPHYNALSDETDLADSWPAEGPPVLWSGTIGRGYSALIAVGGRVYTQRQTVADQSVLCLDADTGSEVWEHRYGWPYEPGGMYPGPRATPTYRDGRIYFASPDGLVGCLRAVDGRRIWSVNVNEKFGGRGTDFGYACSPLVEEGKVILPVGGPAASVVALDARDGSTVWASGSQPASYCSAMPIRLRGELQVIVFLQNTLAAFELDSGRLLWEQGYSHGYDEHAAMPLYDEPHLMTMVPFRGGSQLYRIERQQAKDPPAGATPRGLAATPVRSSRQMSNDVASSVLLGGCVYGFDIYELQTNRHRPSRGEFKCMDLLSGTVRWTTDRVGHATVLAADGKLFLLNDKGELILARASPDRYEELARAAVFPGEICWTAPTLCRGRLYLRSPTRAACLYVGRPERLADDLLARARPVAEIPKTRVVDLTWLVGGEREFPYDAPDLPELARWYLFSLVGVLAAAGVLAALLGGLIGLVRARRARRRSSAEPTRADQQPVPPGKQPVPPGADHRPAAAGWAIFWLVALVLGVAGTPLYNRLGQGFVFTWPVTLFAGQHLTLMAILHARRNPQRAGLAWLSLGAVLVLLVLCLAYYDVCRRVTLAIAWVYLMGFLPSWPLAIPAALGQLRRRCAWVVALWTLLAFSLYFWASGGFIFLRVWLTIGIPG